MFKTILVLLMVLVNSNDYSITPEQIAIVDDACSRYRALDCDLVHAVVYHESSYRFFLKREDVDSVLVRGGMQVKCETARQMGLKFNCDQMSESPLIGLRFGIRYLNYQLRRYEYSVPDALAAYNAGSVIVCKNYNPGKCYPGEVVNMKYVLKNMRRYQWLRGLRLEAQDNQELESKVPYRYKPKGLTYLANILRVR